MISALKNIYRLSKAGLVLGWYGIGFVPGDLRLPLAVRFLRDQRAVSEPANHPSRGVRLSKAMRALGPSYVKLGQFLATRPDVVGPQLCEALSSLRDRLPPFSLKRAKKEVSEAFGRPCDELFMDFSDAVAAASIAQVHKASILDENGRRTMAVKILRPGVEARFARDLESFYFATRTLEQISPHSRRLRPVAAIDILAHSVTLEMDLRLEAAAIAEMAENIARAGDVGFRVPKVDWSRTARRVLTMEWVDAIPMGDLAAIDAAGLDREALGLNVIRSFLRHAMRDGFFHADMHQGNLFVDGRDGTLIAVDFGIMGRLGPKERRFLAEILYGFITKNYKRIADVHFEAGYVPVQQDVAAFAQALRAIGEPIMDRSADEISMARLLTQLFEVTELFQMQMRPELLLLQKTMVVVEGVARTLDPKLNMWIAAEPVVRDWMAQELGPRAKLRDAVMGLSSLANTLRDAPQLIEKSAKLVEVLGPVLENENGRLQDLLTKPKPKTAFSSPTLALWFAATALAAIAIKLWFV